MTEMLSTLEGTAFAARVAVDNIKNLKKAKAALKRAVTYQQKGWGFSFVEFLSACPTNWKMTPRRPTPGWARRWPTTSPWAFTKTSGPIDRERVSNVF